MGVSSTVWLPLGGAGQPLNAAGTGGLRAEPLRGHRAGWRAREPGSTEQEAAVSGKVVVIVFLSKLRNVNLKEF